MGRESEKNTPRPGPCRGAARGVVPGARVFRGPRGHVTNTTGKPWKRGGRLNTSLRYFNRYDFGLCGCQKHVASPFIQCFKCIKISLII